jgi:hypothetical protein
MARPKKKMTDEEIKVARDIDRRDWDSQKSSSKYIPVYDEKGNYREINTGKKPTKLEAMEYLDAWRRTTSQGNTSLLPRAIKELGEQGEREARALRGKASGGEVKKYAAGGAVAAVHKHERAMHKGKPLTKLAKGGSASSRADGCAVKGKTKGRFV